MSDSLQHAIVTALARSLGQEQANLLVKTHAQTLGFSADTMTREQAFKLLEEIANQPGIVGITGRFAKARIHMNGK